MRKRGQITVFIIVGIVILILFSIIYYTRNELIKKEMIAGAREIVQHPFYIIPINRYAETCLKQVSDQGLWLLGVHGGYIDVDDTGFYGPEEQPTLDYAIYDENKVPYFLDNLDLDKPSMEQIKEKLSRYIIVEFQRCLDLSIFDDVEITLPDVNYTTGYIESDLVNSKVTINEETVIVEVKYPLIIRKKDSVYDLSDFKVSLPVRFGMIYDIAVGNPSAGKSLALDIKARWGSADPPWTYQLDDFNCDLYDPLNDTTISATAKDEPDPKAKIILLKDYSAFYHDYSGSYIFQFAIKWDSPSNFIGTECYQSD